MSFWLSFHPGLLSLTGAYWLDDTPDLSCKDGIRQYPADGSPLSCKQQVGGSSPPASSQECKSQDCSYLTAEATPVWLLGSSAVLSLLDPPGWSWRHHLDSSVS